MHRIFTDILRIKAGAGDQREVIVAQPFTKDNGCTAHQGRVGAVWILQGVVTRARKSLGADICLARIMKRE